MPSGVGDNFAPLLSVGETQLNRMLRSGYVSDSCTYAIAVPLCRTKVEFCVPLKSQLFSKQDLFCVKVRVTIRSLIL